MAITASHIAPSPAADYAVAYRVGGTCECRWMRVLRLFTATEAQAQVASLERQGYAARMWVAAELDAFGLPIGWAPELVDATRDIIEAGPASTYWRSRA